MKIGDVVKLKCNIVGDSKSWTEYAVVDEIRENNYDATGKRKWKIGKSGCGVYDGKPVMVCRVK